MQRDAGIHREGLEPLLHQLVSKVPTFVAHEFRLEHQKRPPGYVDRHARHASSIGTCTSA